MNSVDGIPATGDGNVKKPKVTTLFWYRRGTKIFLIALSVICLPLFPLSLIVWLWAIYLLVQTTDGKKLSAGYYYEFLKNYKTAKSFYSMLPNNPDALFHLGMICGNKETDYYNPTLSFQYIYSAARSGNPQYEAKAAQMLLCGDGCEKDLSKAFELFKKSADKGNPEAIRQIASMYENGEGTAINYGQAISYFQRLKDDPEAQIRIARLMQKCDSELNEADEYFTSGEYEKAFESYLKAYASGNVRAAFRIGQMYLEGKGIQQSAKESEKDLTMAADTGKAEARELLGNLYWTEDQSKGVKYLEKAFNAGQKHLAKQLGMYYYDKERKDSDDALAYKYLQSALQQGDVSIAYECGQLAESIGTPEDVVKYYQIAVENGRKEALLGLGRIYYQSKHIKHDSQKAVEYLTKAKEAGCDDALLDLGNVLSESETKEDNFKAVEYYREAMQKKIEKADEALAKAMQKLREKNWAVEIFCQYCQRPEISEFIKTQAGHDFIELAMFSALPGTPSLKGISAVKSSLQHGLGKDIAEAFAESSVSFVKSLFDSSYDNPAAKQRRDEQELLAHDSNEMSRDFDKILSAFVDYGLKFPSFLKSTGHYSERFVKECSDDSVIFPFIIYAFAVDHARTCKNTMADKGNTALLYFASYFRLLLPIACHIENIRNPFVPSPGFFMRQTQQDEIMIRMLMDRSFTKENYSRFPADFRKVLDSPSYDYLRLRTKVWVNTEGKMFDGAEVAVVLLNRNNNPYGNNRSGIDLNFFFALYPNFDSDVKTFLDSAPVF